MFQVFRYAGTQDGWVPVTSPADKKRTFWRFKLQSAINGHKWKYEVRPARSSVFGVLLPSFA